MVQIRRLAISITCLALIPAAEVSACTTILVGKDLTLDGSIIHAHNEDMGLETVGRLWAVPSATHDEGSSLSVPYVELAQSPETLGYWASGNALGTTGLGTSEQSRPYDSVLVGLNEKGVSMSCNWAHSREDAREGVGLRRYAIRQLLLERATSARHGVELLGQWIEKHGQADWGGLIYHLADPEEAWVVETTTDHWVARRIKDDEIHVTANRFRIGTDYDLSSKHLVAHAVAQGWHASADIALDFAQVYGRPERMHEPYDTRREARALELLREKSGAVTVEDLFFVLRDRYEGTEHYTPPQNTPMWRENLESKPSLSRPISTNLAQSTFVAHHRSDMPVAIGAVLWFGLGVPSYTGYAPLYAGATDVQEEGSNTLEAWGDGSVWRLLRRLQQAADPEYDLHQPPILATWAAEHAVTLERQRRLEATVLGEKRDDDRIEQRLRAFSRSELGRILQQATRLTQRFEAPSDPALRGALRPSASKRPPTQRFEAPSDPSLRGALRPVALKRPPTHHRARESAHSRSRLPRRLSPRR